MMSNVNGYKRFEFYLDKLEELLLQSSKEWNPGLWLYTNNARTPLFMLEGLAKLYAGIQNKKKFEKLKGQCKILEDILGAIDYYDSFAKEFVSNSAVPAVVTDYMQGQARENIQRLNEILKEKKWTGDHANKIKKIRKKIRQIDWLEPKEELKAIFNFYKQAIKEIKAFMHGKGDGFTEIESQVHALRRKLRWLSIYPQALQGVIQLSESSIINEQVKKYLTPDIVNSAFNKMPDPGNNSYFLLLEKNSFLALSWTIDALGKLKDRGLKILVTAETLQQTENINREEAITKASEIFEGKKDALQEILLNATTICKTYLTEGHLDKLIYGITSSKKEKV
jgi:hypothetical protein